jgi:UDP-N-acetylmuramate--alanine ligase
MRLHFIGIGGIGLSALARFMAKQGHIVSGSDVKPTKITKKLIEENIEVTTPHGEQNITSDIDYVIYSAVIKNSNIEMQKARDLEIRTISRKESLEMILSSKKVFSVCGAHGKSTTTAILSQILQNSSALIGAESKAFSSNMRFGVDDMVVFEADESDGSFLHSNPYVAIVTNAEPEHMEYYNYDFSRFYGSYEKFLKLAKIRVINAEDEHLKLIDIPQDTIRLYPSVDIKNIEYILRDDEPYTRFELKNMGSFEVWGFGEHIALDASLAILAGLNEIGLEEIEKNIKTFKGIGKRFDVVQKSQEHIIIDDYGHHPTEIKATFDSLKTYASIKGAKSINTIWQPHKYSRTVDNLEAFTHCFEGTDKLILLPVWSAGEKKVDIDFIKEFGSYNLIIADKIEKDGTNINIIRDDKIIDVLDYGISVGFGAGDITYQIRDVS